MRRQKGWRRRVLLPLAGTRLFSLGTAAVTDYAKNSPVRGNLLPGADYRHNIE
jgi:hypothetical protein